MIGMSYPAKYPPAVNPENWNAMVDRVNGFTPSGTFATSYNYLIFKYGSDYYANNAFQTVYGGSSDAGGVDGASFNDVMDAVINALPTNNLGGKTGTIAFAAAIYTVTRKISIPNWSFITFVGVSFESAYELTWLKPSLAPNAFTGGVVFDYTQAGTVIETTYISPPPSGHSGVTVFLGLENIHIRASTSGVVIAVDGSGIFSANFRNFVCSYNLSNVNWSTTPPTAGSIGIKIPYGLNERIVLDHVAVYGFETSYSWSCDHICGWAVEAAYAKYAMVWTGAGLDNSFVYFHALRCEYGIYINGSYHPEMWFGNLAIEWNGTMPWSDGYSFKFGGTSNGQAITILNLVDSNASPYLRYEAGITSYLTIIRDTANDRMHLSPKVSLGQCIDGGTDNAILFMRGRGSGDSVLSIDNADAMVLNCIGSFEVRPAWTGTARRFFFDSTNGDFMIKGLGSDFCTFGVDGSDYLVIQPKGSIIKLKPSSGASEVRIDGDDFCAVTAGKGIRCKTPDGTKIYRIRVDDAGNVVTELAP
jgi:hypothetical protein